MSIRYIRQRSHNGHTSYLVYDGDGHLLTEENTRASALVYLDETLDPATNLVTVTVDNIFTVEPSRGDYPESADNGK